MPKQPEQFCISSQLAVATLQYLSRQPFGDVRQLIGRFEQEIAESQADDARSEAKAEEADKDN